MNKFYKSLIIISLSNAVVFGLGFIVPGLFMLFFLLAVLELIAGFGFILVKDSRETGAALLIAAGITFLIGFSICSSLSYGGHL